MKSLRLLLCASVFAVGLGAPAFAKDPYVTSAMVDLGSLLPPPPAQGSPAYAADLQAVLAAQAQASDARRAQAEADAAETVYIMFTPVLGAHFSAAELPVMSKLFERINDSEGAVVNPTKKLFERPRPWSADPAVKPLPNPSKSFSYPSGHTTRVTMDAIILTAMLPEKKTEIWARAADYANSRVIAGEHYPTDLLGGELSGTVVAELMFQQAGFRADFEAAKVELRTKLEMK